jgi:uncharacterized protein
MNKSKIKRIPDRGVYDRETIYRILDEELFCHVGINYNLYPVVIPTLFGRKEDHLYIHGASVSRLITELQKEIDVCISVATLKGYVLARSAFHHSMNYQSVVIFGKGELIPDSGKEEALKIISDHIIPGRWEEVRAPNRKELKATKVIKIHIDEASAKVRTGGPKDEKEDMELDTWAGVLPIMKKYGNPVTDPLMKNDIPFPESLNNLMSGLS